MEYYEMPCRQLIGGAFHKYIESKINFQSEYWAHHAGAKDVLSSHGFIVDDLLRRMFDPSHEKPAFQMRPNGSIVA